MELNGISTDHLSHTTVCRIVCRRTSAKVVLRRVAGAADDLDAHIQQATDNVGLVRPNLAKEFREKRRMKHNDLLSLTEQAPPADSGPLPGGLYTAPPKPPRGQPSSLDGSDQIVPAPRQPVRERTELPLELPRNGLGHEYRVPPAASPNLRDRRLQQPQQQQQPATTGHKNATSTTPSRPATEGDGRILVIPGAPTNRSALLPVVVAPLTVSTEVVTVPTGQQPPQPPVEQQQPQQQGRQKEEGERQQQQQQQPQQQGRQEEEGEQQYMENRHQRLQTQHQQQQQQEQPSQQRELEEAALVRTANASQARRASKSSLADTSPAVSREVPVAAVALGEGGDVSPNLAAVQQQRLRDRVQPPPQPVEAEALAALQRARETEKAAEVRTSHHHLGSQSAPTAEPPAASASTSHDGAVRIPISGLRLLDGVTSTDAHGATTGTEAAVTLAQTIPDMDSQAHDTAVVAATPLPTRAIRAGPRTLSLSRVDDSLGFTLMGSVDTSRQPSEPDGCYVVLVDSPHARAAGLEVGDRLLSVAGQDVSGATVNAVQRLLAAAGDAVDVVVAQSAAAASAMAVEMGLGRRLARAVTLSGVATYGLGLTVVGSSTPGPLFVAEVHEDGLLSRQALIRVGDQIIAVDNIDTTLVSNGALPLTAPPASAPTIRSVSGGRAFAGMCALAHKRSK